MANRDIITIGGSAGSLEALRKIIGKLPPDLNAAVLVVMHMAPRGRSYLPQILQMQAHLQASEAIEGELIEPGRIYVVPPDRHLLIGDNHLHLTRGPKEGLHRPSINITFRSAAAAYGDRVIGILLSGMLDDGASGLWEIARRGGVTIVQDPDEALFPSMPLNALQDAPVHYKLKASDIGVIVSGLVNGGEMFNSSPGEEPDNPEIQFSGFTCPECRGPLYQKAPAVGKRPGPIEFRCRVGHVLSLKTLFDEHTSTQERKLYEAIVALQEGAELAEYTAAHVAGVLQEELKREAQQLRRHADVVRKLVEERMTPVMD